MSATLYTLEADSKAFKAIVAATIAGFPLDVNEVAANKDGSAPVKLSPSGRFPSLQTADGVISESNAICRYIARARPESNLYGRGFFQTAQVDSYIDWALINLETPAQLQVLPILGQMGKDYKVITKAQEDFKNGLARLEADLALKTFLVGNRLTLADIVVCSVLYYPFKFFMDAEYRRSYPNLTRYYLFVTAQPAFAKVVGPVVPCVTAISPLPGKGGKKGGKKQKKQKKQAKPAKKKADPKPAKKKKEEDPLKALLKGLDRKAMFAVDEWKRQYSNPPGGKSDNYSSMPWFWENYNPETCSLYLQDFKYQEENKMDFMTNNKAKGFMQRSEGIKKAAFGVMQILDGSEKLGYYPLKGVWLFVGQDTKLMELANPEFETFTWTKLDHTNADHKKLVEDYWCSNCEKECDGFTADDWAIFR